MFKNGLTDLSIRRPKAVLMLTALLTLLFLLPLPGMRTDTNPKNMLPPTSAVRVWNDRMVAIVWSMGLLIALGFPPGSGCARCRPCASPSSSPTRR